MLLEALITKKLKIILIEIPGVTKVKMNDGLS